MKFSGCVAAAQASVAAAAMVVTVCLAQDPERRSVYFTSAADERSFSPLNAGTVGEWAREHAALTEVGARRAFLRSVYAQCIRMLSWCGYIGR